MRLFKSPFRLDEETYELKIHDRIVQKSGYYDGLYKKSRVGVVSKVVPYDDIYDDYTEYDYYFHEVQTSAINGEEFVNLAEAFEFGPFKRDDLVLVIRGTTYDE